MTKATLALLLGLCLPAGFAEERTSAGKKPTTITAEQAARYRAKIQRWKAALGAKIAVTDAAEGFRQPTPEEAAALTLPAASGTAVPRQLPGGGTAMESDASQIQFLVAERNGDGSVSVSHRNGAPVRSSKSTQKGGANVR